MSQTPLPETETYAHQQSIENSTFQGANVLQQNIYLGGPPHALPPPSINQNARIAINNGHNNTIYNATGQYDAANSYSHEQVQLQPPYYQKPASSDFVYGLHGFERLIDFAEPYHFGNQSFAANILRRATKQGATNQRVDVPALLGPGELTPTTRSTAKALDYKTGPPLFTNLPRSRLAPPIVIIGNVPQPGKLLQGTSAFAKRVSDSDSTYGDQLVGRPPHNVEPPRNFDISILEINTFFPRWFLLPEVAMRAQVNGWDRKEVAKAQLRAKNQLVNVTKKNFKKASDRIQKCSSEGGKLMFQIPLVTDEEEDANWTKEIVESSNFPKDNLTAVNWHL